MKWSWGLYFVATFAFGAGCREGAAQLTPSPDDAGTPPATPPPSPDAAVVASSPRITVTGPIRLTVGETRAIPLATIVTDNDDPIESLAFETAPSAHIGATVEGVSFLLRASPGFAGTESVGLSARDPAAHSASARFVVIVGDGNEPARRDCTTTFSYRGAASTSRVLLRGSWNGWAGEGDLLTRAGNDWIRTVALPTGDYAYTFVVDGVVTRDTANPRSVFVGDDERSRLVVEDCTRPALTAERIERTDAGQTVVTFRATDGAQGAGLDGAATSVTIEKSGVGGVPARATIANAALNGATLSVTVPVFLGKAAVTASVADRAGRRSLDRVVTAWQNPAQGAVQTGVPFRFRDAVVYFAFVDRFANGDLANDALVPQVDARANFMGGDFAGLTAKVESGYFDDLGVNAIWVPFPGAAPVAGYTGDDGRLYSGYHGYWPRSWDDFEGRFGGRAAFLRFVDAAHRRGIRVIVDLVANHVSNEHPVYLRERTNGWFHPLCVCGESGCGWDDHVFDCWFRPFMPDFDFRKTEAMDAVVASAVDFARATNIDGFRVDAVKHLRPHFVRELRVALDRAFAPPSEPLLLIGETFTGRFGDPGSEKVKEYVGAEFLHGQFDFPLHWEIVATFARREQGFRALDAMLTRAWGTYGAGAVMSAFLGNHDVPRFVSHAAGQIANLWGVGAKEQGWTAPPGQPAAGEAYDRLMLAWTFVLAQPGIPLIYYGDEIGLAGAGDPDNRRMMRFGGDVSTEGQRVLSHVKKVIAARRALEGLRSNDRATLFVDDTAYVFTRGTGDDTVIVALNIGAASRAIDVDVPAYRTRALTERLSGATLQASTGRVALSIPARSSQIISLR
jgi:glycosidase